MKYEVEIVSAHDQIVALSKQRTTFKLVSKEIGPLLSHCWDFIKEHPEFSRRGRNVAIYTESSDGGWVDVGVEVSGWFEDTPSVVCSKMPTGTAATCVHYGPYDQLMDAHAAVRQWCKENNREISGPFWEVYGHWDEDPAKVRTDVFYLLI